MKVFISWSGELSHKVAEEFRTWLPRVIQKLKPFISSHDIDKGERWGSEIAAQLEESFFGIICITKKNLQSPWLNFEAGALSKKFSEEGPDKTRVVPFLIGIQESDIPKGHPLLQFQRTKYEKEDVKQMMRVLNKACGTDCLDQSMLDDSFETRWPQFEEKLNKILEDYNITEFLEQTVDDSSDDSPERRRDRILEELLELTRRHDKFLHTFQQSQATPPIFIYDEYAMLASEILAIRSIIESMCKAELASMLNERLDSVLKRVNKLRSIVDQANALKKAAAEILLRIDQ